MAKFRRGRKKSSVLEYRRLPISELYQRIDDARACRQPQGQAQVRTAIEMAKECYRRDAGPKHVELLGGLYVLRGRELADKSLHDTRLQRH